MNVIPGTTLTDAVYAVHSLGFDTFLTQPKGFNATRFQNATFQGYRLVNELYRPITLVDKRLLSKALNLELGVKEGWLSLYKNKAVVDDAF